MYPSLDILRESFLEWLRVKGFTESTKKSYRIYLGKFIQYLKDEKIEMLDEITPHVVYNYQTHLYYAQTKTERPLSVLTQHNALVVVKTFFQFLIETEKLESDPTSALVLPKKPHTLPDVMTIEEVIKVLEVPNTKKPIGFRNRTILEVLYATGMRISELVNLDVYDIESDEIHIRQGKGLKDRIVPLGEIALDYVREYVKIIRPKLAKDTLALFVSKSGRRMNMVDLLMMVRECGEKAGLAKRITPHTLRHTCATHMLQGGADIRYIQILLGHGSIKSTQVYTHVEISDLKEIHHKYHPRERSDD